MPSTVTVYYPFHPLRRQSLEVLVWPRQAHLPVTVRAPDGSTLKIPLWMLETGAARIDLREQVELSLPAWLALAALLGAHSVVRISAIVDARFSLIVDGETATSRVRRGGAQAPESNVP